MIVTGREGKACDSAGFPVNRIAASMTATHNSLPMRSFPVFPRSRVRSGAVQPNHFRTDAAISSRVVTQTSSRLCIERAMVS